MAKKKKLCPECKTNLCGINSKCCRSCASLAMWERPGYRENLVQIHTQKWAQGDYGDPVQKMKDRWAAGCFDGLSEDITAAWARGDYDSPETRRQYSETSTAMWRDPEYRQHMTEVRKEMWQDPDYYRAQSERAAKQWADGTMDGVHKNPSSLEVALAEALRACGITYVQQHKLDGDGRPFDFFIPPRLLVEVDGDYWHSRPGRAERDMAKTELAKERGFILRRIPERAFKETSSLDIVQERILPLVNEIDNLLEISTR